MEFRILGPIELRADGERHDLGSRKERCVLAVLLWELGRPLSAQAIIERVWGENPPEKALDSFYSNVSRLRKTLRGVSGDSREWLRRSGGYTLDAERDEVDLYQFRQLRDKAKAALASGDEKQAFELLTEADGLWRGVPLATLEGGWADGVRLRLDEERYTARLDRVHAGLRIGRHAELVAEATELAASNPFDETPADYMMRALYLSGRRTEALQVCMEFRRRLKVEMGSDPSARMRDLQQRMLNEDLEPSVRNPARPPIASAAGTASNTLPRDNPDFTGRKAELDTLAGWLTSDLAQSTVPVIVISGMPGVGKSALAIHTAHALRERYTRLLYLPLRAHHPSSERLDPATALRTLLRAQGVRDSTLPETTEDRAALWRQVAHGTLILLDDALDADQVLPLLPATPGCLVLITTRRRSLSLPGMLPLALKTLPTADAIALFARSVGPGHAADRTMLATVVRLCDYLPLEIQLAARHLRRHPAWDLADLAYWLRHMRAEDRDVTCALTLSYFYLTARQQRLFRRLSLHPGNSFSVFAAAAIADESLAGIERGLEVLLDYHLIEEPVPGRYEFHDVIRQYATDLVAVTDQEHDLQQAMHRLLDYYLCLADRADRAIHPFHRRLPLPVTGTTPTLPRLGTQRECAQQLEAEKASLLSVARHAAEHGRHEHAGLLAHVLSKFLDTWGDWTDAIDLHQRAAKAWRTLGHAAGQATALIELSFILGRTGRYDDALACVRDALGIARTAGDSGREAEALDTMGVILWWSARYPEALAAHSRAITIWHGQGDRHGEADALCHSALVYWHQRRSRDAMQRAERALALYREIGDPQGEMNSLNNLGEMLKDSKSYDEAFARYRQSLAMSRSIGNRHGEAIVLNNIADIYRLSGHHDEALKDYRTALEIFREIGDRRSEAETLNSIGAAIRDAGDYVAALVQYEKALVLALGLSERYLQAVSHLGIGSIRLETGSYASAADAYRAAAELSRKIGDPRQEAEALYGLGQALLRIEGPISAREPWLDALGLYQDLGAPEAVSLRAQLTSLGTAGAGCAGN